MATRVVLYARYSSESQREASIEDQLRLCRGRALKEGWQIAEVCSDRALSGATSLRPGYQRLMETVRAGACEVVLAEALDRLSRDQEDVAALYKRLQFASVRLVTLAEGDISELHVGLKGTMNALFLKDLAQKTHRGLRGRVEAGRSGGGNAYGYRVAHRLDATGQPVAGEREIAAAEGAVVKRIFELYATGGSPKAIALKLNCDGIAGPRGGAWSSSTINGNRARGTGILNNELYVGRLVWNKLTYIKDPETGRRRSRQRSAGEAVTIDVPALRIIDDALWDSVKTRQAALANWGEGMAGHHDAPFWSKQRPRYLFSGLMRCGICGGGFSKISAAHFGCSTARNKGPTACINLLTIRRDRLEATVLDGLATRLMNPDLFKLFASEFMAEWNRLQAEAACDIEGRTAELGRVRAQIERLVDALANGTPAAAVNGRIAALEERRILLEKLVSSSVKPAPRLHPNLAEVYRQKVSTLAASLASEESGEARELVRGLIEAILLVPEGDSLRVEIRGELAAILSLASAAKSRSGAGDASAVQVKMVAGTGFGRQLTPVRVAC